ncbi:MAG: DotD/TraH family lipoprotein [Rhodopila sp.]|jgi:DotD protein
MRRLFLLLLPGLVMSGCTIKTDQTPPAVAVAGTADANRALSEAVASVDRAMTQMQGEFNAPATPGTLNPATPGALNTPPATTQSYVPVELQRPFDVNLPRIDLDQAAHILSGYAGYQLQIVNPDRRPPVTVSLTGNRVPLLDLFQSLGAQAGSKVDVLVNANTRTVQLTYRADAPNA